MNALSASGARCTRLLLAFGLAVLVASPAVVIWASRVQMTGVSGDDTTAAMLELSRMEARQVASLALPPAHERNRAFSPFGDGFDRAVVKEGERRGMLDLNIGTFDPARPDELLSRVPQAIRFGADDVKQVGRGALVAGLNYLQIAPAAISERRAAEAHAGIEQQGARIISYLREGWVLADVDAEGVGRLRQNQDIARFQPMEPAFKLALDIAKRPLINKARAESPELHLQVFAVPGTDMPGLQRGLKAIQGVADAVEFGPNGFLVRADYRAVARLARERRVLWIQEEYEMMTLNAKNSPTMQMGSLEDGLQIRPFDDAGVDGGGIDTNTDGQRINNGTDAVPPQIVTVTDNGISTDTPNFSQTATLVTDLIHPIGPAHRKVHALHNIRDTNQTCDSVLSGAGTHGSTVAAVIAAYPSQLGVFATRQPVGGAGIPRNANMDGVARGARIISQDIADTARCTINSLIERGGNVDPGSLLALLNRTICPRSGGVGDCAGVVGGGTEAHLAVFPFGAPSNFSTTQFLPTDGTYPQEAADIDTFLFNNRDYMVFAPVGNSGGLLGANRVELAIDVVPDLFNGTAADDDPNSPRPIQVSPPSTAKNLTSVGVSRSDCVTFFGALDCESRTVDFSSHGPATPESLRMAPILTAPASDIIPTFETASIAVFRSRDNDNADNTAAGRALDFEIDEGNFGSSFAAANVTGAAAIVRDYFAQGFYPTGERSTANRVPNVSGALVKAALVASAKFNTLVSAQSQDPNEIHIRRTRSMDLGSPAGVPVGVLGNSEQGYGRVLLTGVLPLANWSKGFAVNPTSNPEFPAAGLLAWDDIATGEPLLDNTTTSRTHTFRVSGANTGAGAGGGLAVFRGELRVALAWTDRPSLAGSGGPLVNDLDLIVESPGPDNCIGAGDIAPNGSTCAAGTEADNQFYDGNVYFGGRNNPVTDQWSRARPVGAPETHDRRNPVEAVHLNSDPSNNFTAADAARFNDSPLHVGTWRATVRVGGGGAIPGSLTIGGPNEDANGNRRLDAGEDTNANGLLDLGGQSYALVVAGPVFLAEAAPSRGPSVFPNSSISLSQIRYSCADSVVASILDAAGGTPAQAQAGTTFTVRNAAGAILDSEASIAFTAGASGGTSRSAGVPVRLNSGPPSANNGILEADTGNLVVATYAPAVQAPVSASAQVKCSPDLVPGFFATEDNNAFDDQIAVGSGCDDDDNLDAGEVLTYGIGINNRSRTDDYNDLVATLTPSGPGAAAIRVLDSPRNVGRLPGNGFQGIFFHVAVDAAAANALTLANRRVTMTLTLDSAARGQRVGRQSYAFTHAINSDRETLHYSTDFPAGGRQVRDLNRNLVIDRPDEVDPFLQFLLPDEDVTFSSMFTPGTASGLVTNTLGEDLNNNGILDAGEDTIPNNQLDRGILFAAGGPSSADKAPFNFDNGNGGWIPLRHPGSTPANVSANPLWEYKTSGLCGFQTSIGGIKGMWHTGDGDPTTPVAGATACENHGLPRNAATEARVELLMDVLHSPIVAKVNQAADSRGFAFGVEFQRAGWNVNMQTFDAYAGGGINIDNNIDSDSANCLLCQQLDTYYTRRTGGWPYGVFRFSGQYFDALEQGIDPASDAPVQRTFGPLDDPDGGTPVNAVSGFSGFTLNSNPDSTSPIPQAPPDFLAYPLPGAPVPGVCAGGAVPGDPCQTSSECAGGTCTLAANDVAGPVRNFDTTLVNYEGQFASEILAGTAAQENFFFFTPGPAGNRWQLGLGFFSIENSSGTADYGFGVDDVVFEWDEFHPKDETAAPPLGLGLAPACSRFGGPGQAAGAQCATITVDRGNLYECEEAVEITVVDPDIAAGTPSIEVAVVTDSDSVQFATIRFSVLQPNAKRYTLAAVPGSPGLFRGVVTFSSATNTPQNVFTNPGTDAQFIVYYVDPTCDGDTDGAISEDQFDNLDGDGVASSTDNCAFTYNPTQGDVDADGVGDLCDNCPAIANADQEDANADDVGDACENDDIDLDGFDNAVDNCPDIPNGQLDVDADGRGDPCDNAVCRNQINTSCTSNADCPLACSNASTRPCTADTDCTLGGTCTAPGQCRGNIGNPDRDGDGTPDAQDNCPLTSNGNQRNADADGSGDRCDPDCTSLTISAVCTVDPNITCSSAADCPSVCSNSPSTPCTASTDCPGTGGVCGGSCTQVVRSAPSATCSNVDDDLDVDGVADTLDNCAAIANAAIIPGTQRQRDSDRDGLGDVCDPTGTLDDDFDGVPDDLVTFQGTVACRTLPLARFAIISTAYLDIDGDQDIFPDTGETGRVTVQIRNLGAALTGATFVLTSTDPDVDCITTPTVVAGNIAAGQTITVGTLNPAAGPGFQFRASNGLQTISPANPAKIDLCLTATANESLGTTAPVCFGLLADLELPVGVTQTFIPGPDGAPGTGDDGTIFETFDIDRDADGNITVNDTFRNSDGTHGFYLRGSDTGIGTNVVAGVPCGGYTEAAAGNDACVLDPDFPMDWHVHCAPGATNCPNVETGPCVGGCSYSTPTDGQKAFSPPNSLHMGAHFVQAATAQGDTTHFRALQAFVTSPINLALFPRPGDLQLSMFHIADLMDNSGVGGGNNERQCADCGDVQVQVDLNTDPNIDEWGFWDKLVPFQNVYDHKVMAWSAFSPYYCIQTPTDTGTAAPAPRGVHETMCFPQGAWSHCGSARGTSPSTVFDCTGPGVVDPSGIGVWVETRFNLASYLGQRVRIRWIGTSWTFDFSSSSYFEVGGGWDATLQDDGWWLDNVTINGAITTQLTPPPDPDPAPATSCPASCNPLVGDRGTNVALSATDLSDGTIDGVSRVAVSGQTLRISAVATTLPGGCNNGVPQFRFFRNGVMVQDWAAKTFFQDSPEEDTVYSALARCSSNFSCTSQTGATLNLAVYEGDGTDISVTAAHNRATGVTTLSWSARPQQAPMAGYDVFRGSVPPPQPTLANATCFSSNVPQAALGTPVSVTDSTTPAAGTALYYLVGHSNPTAGARATLGRGVNNAVRIAPVTCP